MATIGLFIKPEAIKNTTYIDENVDEKYAREVEPRKQELRMKYAKHHNFFIDLQIIFLTIESLFKLRSLWNTKN